MSTCKQAIRARRKARIDPRYQRNKVKTWRFKGHTGPAKAKK